MRFLFTFIFLLGIAAPAGSVTFTDVTSASFFDSEGTPVELIDHNRGLIQGEIETPNQYGPGVAWVDLNADGWLDLVVGNGHLSNDGTETVGNYLLLNNGDGTFTEMAQQWDIYESRGTDGIAAADIDNDGDADVILGNYYREMQIMVSAGGQFNEVAEAYAVNPLFYDSNSHLPPDPTRPETMGISLGDYNADGFVDIYVANYSSQRDIILRSSAGTYFFKTDHADVTSSGNGFQGVWCDFDNDRDLDVFVANDFGYNFLFENLGADSGWEFIERGKVYRVMGGQDASRPKSMGMGVAVADFNNDLNLDIYITNYRLNSLYVNPGPPEGGGFFQFTEEANARGVEVADDEAVVGWNDWGCDFADLDNDGDLDLMVNGGWIFASVAAQPFNLPNKLWLNNGPPDYDFTDVSSTAGFDFDGAGRGLATADYDRDGDLDVIITNVTYQEAMSPLGETSVEKAMLYRNDQAEGNHWVIFALQGGGPHTPWVGCNRDGIGARVYLTAGGQTQMREVQAGSSYLSQNSIEVEFGLGANETIEQVEVHWICGANENFTGIDVDRAWRLIEGTGMGTGVPVALSSFFAEANDEGILLRWVLVPGASLSDVRVFRAPSSDPERFSELILPVEIDGHAGRALDTTVRPGQSYVYRLELYDDDGLGVESPTVLATAEGGDAPLRRVQLGQNFPNPFNPRTSLFYSVPTAMEVRFAIYDVKGRLVRTLVDGQVEAGEHREEWDGLDNAGKQVPAGVYHYRLVTEEVSSVRRMVLVR